jgi:hypothetical protein
MDTSLNIPAPSTLLAAPASVLDRYVTSKVAPIDASDSAATRSSEKPFVAQVVTERLSGTEFPENPGEIAPQGRTLRPYNVPMLPYSAKPATAVTTGNPESKEIDQTTKPGS